MLKYLIFKRIQARIAMIACFGIVGTCMIAALNIYLGVKRNAELETMYASQTIAQQILEAGSIEKEFLHLEL